MTIDELKAELADQLCDHRSQQPCSMCKRKVDALMPIIMEALASQFHNGWDAGVASETAWTPPPGFLGC